METYRHMESRSELCVRIVFFPDFVINETLIYKVNNK